MQTVTFKKAFPFTKGLDTTHYEPGFTGEVTNDVADAAKAAGALEEKAGGSDKGSPKGDTDGTEG